jgi:hypothetical protein
MPSLYFKMNLNLELFATDKDGKEALLNKDEIEIDNLLLHYKSGQELTKKHGEGAYDIYVYPNDFLKKSEINLLTENKLFITINGVAKISPKADLYQYLIEDKNPSFFFKSIWIKPVAQLYASKKEAIMSIDCTCSKSKP